MKTALAGAMLGLLAVLSGCGNSLPLTHSETACVHPGETVTLHTHTDPDTTVGYVVQDDFGGTIATIPAQTTDPSGNLTVTWQAPGQLSTTTLHFLLTARHGDLRANRDVHVVVGGNGRTC